VVRQLRIPVSQFRVLRTGTLSEIRPDNMYQPLPARLKKEKNKQKLTEKNLANKNKMTAPKRFSFADALLPFGTIREAHAHCTHLQIARANSQTKICKRVQFLPTL
ncbi:hypothetical protein, partial [Maribellus maritimus]|uniref:hypothetical protein n=1 Tax=Maribellus maritimus TaxID=2870838 RepID=UPI001EEA61F8